MQSVSAVQCSSSSSTAAQSAHARLHDVVRNFTMLCCALLDYTRLYSTTLSKSEFFLLAFALVSKRERERERDRRVTGEKKGRERQGRESEKGRKFRALE